MDYSGSTPEAGQALGRRREDGIDGVISQDKLKLDRVYIQVKRYAVRNSMVITQHDMRAVAQADWVIDVGPGAGKAGRKIVACGTPREVAQAQASRTAPALACELK